MKKKLIIWVVIVVAVAITALCVVLIKQYYDDRYVTDDYFYTIVPLDYDYTPSLLLNSDGAAMGYEKAYTLIWYNADGVAREFTFRARLDVQELYPPGTYVMISVSKRSVLGQSAIPETDVPEAALIKIKENFEPSSATTLVEYAQERTAQLSGRNTPSLTISCDVDDSGTALIYTYLYITGAREMAEDAAVYQDHVYRAQFRTDKDTFPELSSIYLEIILEDGTIIFSQKYDTRITFSYDS
jgi:uncharacterized protein YxeA